jgi:hypothetical protein
VLFPADLIGADLEKVPVRSADLVGHAHVASVRPGFRRFALGSGPAPAQVLLQLGDVFGEVPDLLRGHRRVSAKANHPLEADQSLPPTRPSCPERSFNHADDPLL